MFKTRTTRFLILLLLGLALALSAVGAYAAVRDDSDQSTQVQDSQQGDDDAGDAEDNDDEASKPWIGIAAGPNPDGDGVIIRHVMPGSPADESGLEQGDVITAVDGDDVADLEDVHDAISDKAPGDTVTLTVTREDGDGGSEEVTLTLGEAPRDRIKDFKFSGPLADLFDGGFDQFLGGEFRYLDGEGNEVTIEAVPGSVTAVADASITIDVNGDEGERTFDLGEAAAPEDLAEGDSVTVLLKDGEVTAVLPGLGKFGIPGLPGFGHGPGPRFGGPSFNFEDLPLPDHFRDWIPDIQPREESADPDA